MLVGVENANAYVGHAIFFKKLYRGLTTKMEKVVSQLPNGSELQPSE